MMERTTEREISFLHPFRLNSLVEALDAGKYRLVIDEELIEGLSFPAYKRTGTHLEIPAIGLLTGNRQFLQVSQEEIDAALLRDAQLDQ